MTETLFFNNLRWAAAKNAADPEYFSRLAGQDHAEIFWLGCCDCRVPANELIGLAPGSVFVHRNIAHLASAHDGDFLSSLQYALDVLHVHTIVVCGHYGCTGVRAALAADTHPFVQQWLAPLRRLSGTHAEELEAVRDADARANALCELNVIDQVVNIAANPLAHEAWRRGQTFSIHGWVYSPHDGLLRDLETSARNFPEALHLTGVAPSGDKRKRLLRPARRNSGGKP
jgi:carbonic anhydrase